MKNETTEQKKETKTQDNMKHEQKEDVKSEALTQKDQITKLEQDHKLIVDDLTNTLKRLQAEFENYRKRVDHEKQEFVKYSNRKLIEKFLPLLDNLELAVKNKDCKEDFVHGVELIFGQFYQMLEDEGVKRIEVKGKYNPITQEALIAEESELEPGTVLEVFQNGYKLNDSVIRHAKVKIAKSKSSKKC